jgi:predicted PurR-regulated permease PerM
MRKGVLLTGLIPMIGVLLLTIIAYGHSLTVSRMYDARMRADIQACARQLTQSGLSGAQVQAVQSVLNEVNHNSLSYVSSEADSVIGTAGFMGVIIMSAVLGLAARMPNQTKG